MLWSSVSRNAGPDPPTQYPPPPPVPLSHVPSAATHRPPSWTHRSATLTGAPLGDAHPAAINAIPIPCRTRRQTILRFLHENAVCSRGPQPVVPCGVGTPPLHLHREQQNENNQESQNPPELFHAAPPVVPSPHNRPPRQGLPAGGKNSWPCSTAVGHQSLRRKHLRLGLSPGVRAPDKTRSVMIVVGGALVRFVGAFLQPAVGSRDPRDAGHRPASGFFAGGRRET